MSPRTKNQKQIGGVFAGDSHSLFLTLTHFDLLSHAFSCILTHSRSLTHPHSLSLSLTLTHSHSLSLTHSHSHSLTLTHAHTLARTYPFFHFYSHSLTLFGGHTRTTQNHVTGEPHWESKIQPPCFRSVRIFELPTLADTGICSVERPCFLPDHIRPLCTEDRCRTG